MSRRENRRLRLCYYLCGVGIYSQSIKCDEPCLNLINKLEIIDTIK